MNYKKIFKINKKKKINLFISKFNKLLKKLQTYKKVN